MPDDRPQIQLQRAIAALNGGRAREAAALCRELLADAPDSVEPLHLLGIAQQALGEFEPALASLRRARELKPSDPQIQANLGVTLARLGRLEEAIAAFEASLMLAPDAQGARGNLCMALKQAGRTAEWMRQARDWNALAPDDPNAALQLAQALAATGDAAGALAAAERALALRPKDADARIERGQALAKLGRNREAAAALRGAVELAPKRSDIRLRLAMVEADLHEFEKAVGTLEAALVADPTNTEALTRLAAYQTTLCRMADADRSFARILAIRASPGTELMRATTLCPIETSEADMLERRRRYREQVAALRDRKLRLEDPYREAGYPHWFYLAYHGLDDRPLQEELASFFLEACPALGERAAHVDRPAGNKRARIGVVSSFLGSHTIGTLLRGLLAEMDKTRFEILLFRPNEATDEAARRIDRSASRTVRIPRDLAKARRAIAECELDLLYFPDIGMDSFTYFLAFARLAPVQIVSWGHPDTTGIANLDYFLSVASFEPESAEVFYSERLIKLSRISSYFYRPDAVAPAKTRADFGLPEKGSLYLCLASLFKFHPRFDAILDALLARDPSSHIVMNTGHCTAWDQRLTERVARRNPAARERMHFLKWIPHPDFFSLARLADAFLDPIIFGGGRTCLELWAYGVPIVTWPGPYLRGRIAYGGYRQMGYTDLVARDSEHYVELCLELANDKAKRARVGREVADAAGTLYEDKAAVREIEDFFLAAIDAARRGEKLAGWPK